jgi:NADPH-dependent curcumin reductase CurA
MTGWLKSGAIQRRETVLEGLDRAPAAIVGLFSGLNAGKMLLRLG